MKLAVGSVWGNRFVVSASRRILDLGREEQSLRALESVPREQVDMVDASRRSSRGVTLAASEFLPEKTVIDNSSAVDPFWPPET